MKIQKGILLLIKCFTPKTGQQSFLALNGNNADDNRNNISDDDIDNNNNNYKKMQFMERKYSKFAQKHSICHCAAPLETSRK